MVALLDWTLGRHKRRREKVRAILQDEVVGTETMVSQEWGIGGRF